MSGHLTKYEYDGAGRLTTIRDENNNRVNSYTYALTNGGSGSPNSISSITHTVVGSSATAGVRDVSYFDGLGRTVQTVAVNASTAANGSSVLRDIVPPVCTRLPRPGRCQSLHSLSCIYHFFQLWFISKQWPLFAAVLPWQRRQGIHREHL